MSISAQMKKYISTHETMIKDYFYIYVVVNKSEPSGVKPKNMISTLTHSHFLAQKRIWQWIRRILVRCCDYTESGRTIAG